MFRRLIVRFSLVLLATLAGCQSGSVPATGTVPAAATAVPGAPGAFDGGRLPAERGKYFAAAGACTGCHSGMKDASGANVALDADWRASMMANAARDPYWQASMRAEVLNAPDMRAAIEDKCATCHMPMARYTAVMEGGQGKVLDDGFADPSNPLHLLAMDGDSCTLCHQIGSAALGEPDSFSGGYEIDTAERVIHGRFELDATQAGVMQQASGYRPVQSSHVTQSELCAACHTLYTPYLDEEGKVAGNLPEQMPYVEWSHSRYRETASCQDCHMPVAQGAVALSATGGTPRSPFHQHAFTGGNLYAYQILRAFGPDLQVTASSAQFDAAIARAETQLQEQTATAIIENVALDGTKLSADVVLSSATGHKFPTGYPSRRAWLHITVRDASGAVVFESGGVDEHGAIAGNDNDADAGRYEPHYREITQPGQVQIYEAIMQDTGGRVTTELLRGAAYAKDNRLLPAGFDKASASADIAVLGEALTDADFAGGGDRVHLAIDVAGAQGPFTIEAELLYQSIGYRWIDNLRAFTAPEIQRFLGYADALPGLPARVSAATATTK